MRTQLRVLLAIAATAAITAGTAVAQSSGSADAGHSKMMHQQMMNGMQQMQQMPMTGNMDKDFATMMRHHHMQGIEMAKMELALASRRR